MLYKVHCNEALLLLIVALPPIFSNITTKDCAECFDPQTAILNHSFHIIFQETALSPEVYLLHLLDDRISLNCASLCGDSKNSLPNDNLEG